MTFAFEDFQLSGLQLRRPTSQSEIKQLREKCESVVRSFNSSDYSQCSEKAPDDIFLQQKMSSYLDISQHSSFHNEIERKPSIRL
jgi:hypothetical protein